MNMFQSKDHLLGWSTKLRRAGYVSTPTCCLSVRCDNFMIITPPEFNTETASSKEMIAVYLKDMAFLGVKVPHPDYILHAAIYNRRKDIGAIIHTTQPNILTASRAGRTIPPLLDDMAQIVGTSARIARYHQPVDEATIVSVLKHMRKRNAVLLSDAGALCCADSLDNALAVAQVLEKNCKAFIEASFIGGGIRINPVEAYLMRLVYKLKYSKQDQLNR